MEESTTPEAIREMLGYVNGERDPYLRLLEIDKVNMPLDGRPRLILRGERDSTISAALEQLRAGHGLDLLDDLSTINVLKLAYKSQRPDAGDTPKVYVAKLTLKHLAESNRYAVHYYMRTSLQDRRDIENYLYNEYDIRIVSTDR